MYNTRASLMLNFWLRAEEPLPNDGDAPRQPPLPPKMNNKNKKKKINIKKNNNL